MIKLLVKSGEQSREMEFEQAEITIGRASDNVLALPDRKASRKHARIAREGEIYRVIDLGSGNGTKVNGAEVTAHELAKGDEIRVGLSTIYVIDVPGAAAAAPPPPVPAPVEPGAPDELPAPPPIRPITVRTDRKSASYGSWVAVVSMILMLAGSGYAAWKYGLIGGTAAPSTAAADPKTMPEAREAEAAYLSFKARADTQTLSDAIIAEAEGLADKFPGYPPCEALVRQLKQRRNEQIGKMTFAQVNTLVEAALQERRFGSAVESLRALKNVSDSDQVSQLVEKVNAEIRAEFKSVDDYGKKLADEKKYFLAIDHYRTHAPRFRGTEHFKYLSTRPEMLEELGKSEAAADAAMASRRTTELASTKTEPAPPPPAAEPEMPAPEPAGKKMEAPKPKPEPARPKAMMKPPPPAPAMKAPEKPEPPRPAASSSVRFQKPAVLCDCKKIAKGYFCIACNRMLGMDDMRNGSCKRCEEKPKKIDLCLKRFYQAECHPDKISNKPVACDGKIYDFPHEDMARIAHLCESCDEWGDTPGDIQHKADCKSRLSTLKVCQKSGTGGHVPDK